MAVEQIGLRTFAEMENALTAGRTITPAGATTLVGGGNSAQHFHSTDRDRANHTGTQTVATISDFDTEVANNTAVAANTAKNSYPIADSTKVGFISVTQAVDLDDIEKDVDVVRDIDTVTLVSTTWTLDHESLRAKDFKITSADATAKTIAFSNVSGTASKIEIGVVAVFTTACAVAYPSGTTWVDGAPTFADGETWGLAFLSLDNGTSWYGKYNQLN